MSSPSENSSPRWNRSRISPRVASSAKSDGWSTSSMPGVLGPNSNPRHEQRDGGEPDAAPEPANTRPRAATRRARRACRARSPARLSGTPARTDDCSRATTSSGTRAAIHRVPASRVTPGGCRRPRHPTRTRRSTRRPARARLGGRRPPGTVPSTRRFPSLLPRTSTLTGMVLGSRPSHAGPRLDCRRDRHPDKAARPRRTARDGDGG